MPTTATAPAPLAAHLIRADLAAHLLRALGLSTAVHTRPMCSAVDACTWCDLSDPEPAVVQFAGTDAPDACLGCARSVAEHAIESADSDLDADRIHADIYAIDCPSVTSEVATESEIPGRVTVTDADAVALAVDSVGIEVLLVNPLDWRGGHLARFDISTVHGRAALVALRNALDAAIAQAA